RQSRVPGWNYLEKIVTALNGDTAEFLDLWQAAWQAQNSVETPQVSPHSLTPPGLTAAQRIWSNEIPRRNPDFTGRPAERAELGSNIAAHDDRSREMRVIVGMGGIGKPDLPGKFVYRHIDQYEIVWWIRAEHHDRVREALVGLGQRLELREAVADPGR